MEREIAKVMNQIAAKQLVNGIAMAELIRVLPASIRATLAEQIRSQVNEALHDMPGSGDMDMEGAATLQLAVFLEAAGQPPKR